MQEYAVSKVVITGPTGAVGTALCRDLLENGCEVWAVCRKGSARADRLPQDPRLHLVACDLDSLAQLPALMPEGMDVFYHFAWADTIGPGRNDMPRQIRNIAYAVDAVQAAAALGCHTFIGAGSQAEYGRVEGLLKSDTPAFPENGYGMAKLCAGQMTRVECQKLGLRHIWVRILSVYGPGDGNATMISSVIRALQAGACPACTAGEQLWDYLYSGDAAQALYRMAKFGRDGAVYPLGSGRAMPLRRYIETLRDTIDPDLSVGFGQIPYGPKQVMHLQADISALRADTGFSPETSFEEGIKHTIDWMNEHE